MLLRTTPPFERDAVSTLILHNDASICPVISPLVTAHSEASNVSRAPPRVAQNRALGAVGPPGSPPRMAHSRLSRASPAPASASPESAPAPSATRASSTAAATAPAARAPQHWPLAPALSRALPPLSPPLPSPPLLPPSAAPLAPAPHPSLAVSPRPMSSVAVATTSAAGSPAAATIAPSTMSFAAPPVASASTAASSRKLVPSASNWASLAVRASISDQITRELESGASVAAEPGVAGRCCVLRAGGDGPQQKGEVAASVEPGRTCAPETAGDVCLNCGVPRGGCFGGATGGEGGFDDAGDVEVPRQANGGVAGAACGSAVLE
eukprot:scaffold9106_cov118-Isochrysis_galbana.AAC.2